MKTGKNYPDKVAIGLSVLCTLHCLALPVLILFIPSALIWPIGDEAFHLLMVLLVVSISLGALIMGLKEHDQWSVLITGVIGLVILVLPFILGVELIGEIGEAFMTVIATVIIAYSHYLNYRERRALSEQQ